MNRRRYRLSTAILSALAAVAVGIISTRVFPYHSINHDEAVYLQQAAMLLDGQLFVRPPVEDALRPWFFVEDGDRLYPKYNPVPAALFAIGRLLGGYRIALVGIAAVIVALVVGVGRQVFDRPTGLLAGALVLASPLFLIDASVFLPYAPTALLNLTFAYAYLRADRTARSGPNDEASEPKRSGPIVGRVVTALRSIETDERRWALLAGTAIGLAFFARPYTAVLFAAPFIAHACWTLATDWRETLGRQTLTAATGTLGVCVTLGYNAAVTGSPFLFPFLAFAPEDGIGFGHRQILTHEVVYTPQLALASNARVLVQFGTDWIAGGPLGVALVLVGLTAAVRQHRDSQFRPDPRASVVAGLFVTVVAGNVYFWGNYNILGALTRSGDGLIALLGPYYHFDLLVPTAIFGARGALAAWRWLRRTVVDGRGRLGSWLYDRLAGRLDGRLAGRLDGRLASRLDGRLASRLDGRLASRLDGRPASRRARAIAIAVLLVSAGVFGGSTAADVSHRIDENAEVTATYADAYEPFADGPPANSLILVGDPYGDWLAHPFQPLRNGPDFDGRAVYALDDRPFAVVEAFPNRTVYRYVYRGVWAPEEGSPDVARLQRVRDVRGSTVRLSTTVGIPRGAASVTTRVSTAAGEAYFVGTNGSGSLDIEIVLSNRTVRVMGDIDPTGNRTLPIDGRETVRITVFVDYGAGSGFTYRLDVPVLIEDREIRALSPRIERCLNPRACGGAAAFVPETAPDGVFVRTNLTVREG